MSLKKSIDFLTSRNFALILLGALILLTITAMVIPQDSPVNQQAYTDWAIKHPDLAISTRKLGLSSIISSPLFLFISFLLFTSTLLCTWRQAKFTRRLLKSLPALGHPQSPGGNLGKLAPGCGLAEISDVLSAHGYHGNIDEEENFVRAFKHSFGFWGSVVLHLGFVIIMVGVLLSSLTKMEGYMFLGEGQTVTEDARSYTDLKESRLFSGHKGFSLRLDKLNIVYPENKIPYVDTVKLTVLDGDQQTTHELQRGRFLNYRGIKLLPYVRGYAVGLVITDSNNRELGGGFYHLTTRWHDPDVNPREVIDKTANEAYADTVSVDGLGLTVKAKFYPDYILNQGVMSTKTLKPDNPALDIEVRKADQVIYKGPLKLGDKVKIGDKLLHFPVYRNNITMQVVSDKGTPVIFSGFGISLLGLVLLYFFNPRQLWFRVDPADNLLMWSKCFKFPVGFQEELTALSGELKENMIEKGEL